jgi:NAD(P)-dependent dehydrogenase (short-subunit alcohol dehydrogenase family)
MSNGPQRLRGQVAVVTGAARGIGKAIAARLGAEGSSIVVADANHEDAATTAAELGGLAVQTDVSDSGSVNNLANTVIDRFGRVDILVNNAGVHIQKLAIDLTDEEWNRIQNVNARGCFYICRAFAPHMMQLESGRIINVTTRLVGNPFSSAYIASKSAIWGFTQCLALELARYGVAVNAVAPGHVALGTGMETQFRAKAQKMDMSWDRFQENVLSTIPLGRWCTPEDVAATVAFLASEDAKYITGEQINVTGGWTGYSSTPPKEAQ